jgi:WD40 repeat protein
LEEENDEEEYGTHFKQHPYFDIHSSRSELSSNSPGMSSVITDTGSFAGDDSENPAESPRQQQAELTEDLLDQVPYGVSGQVNTSDWLAMLSNDTENPNPSPGNVLADWNVDDLPSLYKRVGDEWFAVFNTEVQRVLDVELVHHIVHDSIVCCVRFSWDGKYVATGCRGSAQIFDVATGQSVATLQDESVDKDGDMHVRSVCFSPDGEYLATGSEDNQIRVR